MIPVDCSDATNRAILAVAEDCIKGFYERPFAEIARRCGVAEPVVIERLAAMRRAGTIRRVRQTLLSTSLAEGALVAWKVPEEKLEQAYAWLLENDPFTGHIVLRRSDDPGSPGAAYRLWTTLKVPTGYGSLSAHCALLSPYLGAEAVRLLPVVGMFSLGVGHIRRAGLKPGDRSDSLPPMQVPERPVLSREEWAVLLSLKESLSEDEFVPEPWVGRAAALGMSAERYVRVAQGLDARRVIGRFAAFLDHARPQSAEAGVGAAGLFHWTVPPGMEERAGAEVGRHLCMTHCYWRSGAGEDFAHAQIMGVTHATDEAGVRAHKAAIDAHLAAAGIPVLHTAVFWSERAEIRPSEISPAAYEAWLARRSR